MNAEQVQREAISTADRIHKLVSEYRESVSVSAPPEDAPEDVKRRMSMRQARASPEATNQLRTAYRQTCYQPAIELAEKFEDLGLDTGQLEEQAKHAQTPQLMEGVAEQLRALAAQLDSE